ncbi:hypothetical protein [Fructilactobacillus cliffordii]|uniref:Uncharacterized protein n=1 Tax=Fructilactobacillus cliffordii TaxID=2940299 RepID=A0A9Q9E199_9LACO|nr:hypothetical protein [Fructilactobacillus cliffordii]USS89976.1 hypothetical protein M3M40_07250 [Fructilactobacillus cliffordii]
MNPKLNVRLNATNLNRFSEIKDKLIHENILDNGSNNEIINFIIKAFYQLFVLNVEDDFYKQETKYLTTKSNFYLPKENKKLDYIDENIEVILYILLGLNEATNAGTIDPDSTFKSIFRNGNDFNALFQKAQNSIARDKKIKSIEKHRDM